MFMSTKWLGDSWRKHRDKLKVGDKIPYWHSQRDGTKLAIILAKTPYTGRYTEYFKYNLRLTSNTAKGYIDTVV